MAKQYRYPAGYCYHSAFDMLKRHGMKYTDNVKICHGIATLTREPFTQFGHAWIEEEKSGGVFVVYDPKHPATPVPLGTYYVIGKISFVVRYTYREARRIAETEGHFGPWAKTIEQVEHAGEEWQRFKAEEAAKGQR